MGHHSSLAGGPVFGVHYRRSNPRNWDSLLVEVDIRKFFDTLDHAHLRALLRQRIRDGVLLRLIEKWLKAGVLEGGQLTHPSAGTPQGGVISPLLANVYLHYVRDVWFEREVKPRLRGRAFLIRYADDFIMGFACEADARRLLEVLPKRFGRYGLTLHPDKTRMVSLDPGPILSTGEPSCPQRVPFDVAEDDQEGVVFLDGESLEASRPHMACGRWMRTGWNGFRHILARFFTSHSDCPPKKILHGITRLSKRAIKVALVLDGCADGDGRKIPCGCRKSVRASAR